MAPGLATATANSFLDALLNNTAYQIGAVWIQLHTANPGAAGTTAIAGETDRMQMTFAAAASGSCSSDADTTWTSVASTETYSHISAWTASTAGTFLFSAALTTPKNVNAGDNFTIALGSGTLSFTPIAA